MRRLTATAVIVIALVASFAAGTITKGDIMPAEAASLTEPVSVKLTTIVRANDRIYVNFADGTQYEFNDIESLTWWMESVQTTDNAQKLALAWVLARDPDLSNPQTNKTLTLNVSSPAPIKVQ